MVFEDHADELDRDHGPVEGQEDSPDQKEAVDGELSQADDPWNDHVRDEDGSEPSAESLPEGDAVDAPQSDFLGSESSTPIPSEEATAMPPLLPRTGPPAFEPPAQSQLDAASAEGDIAFSASAHTSTTGDAEPLTNDSPTPDETTLGASELTKEGDVPPLRYTDEALRRKRDAASRVEQAFFKQATAEAGHPRTRRRLEIEVEVTVQNVERITRIAIDESKRTLKQVVNEPIEELRFDLFKLTSEIHVVFGRY